MKRGKRFFENENLFIYVGTGIFFVLAIAIGIIMYMAADTNSEIGKVEQNVVEEQQIKENTESASTEMGKTVKEQEQGETEAVNTTGDDNTTVENEVNQNTTTSTVTNETEESSISTTENTTVNSQVEVENKEIEEKKEITFVKPVEGEVICEFAKDNLIYSETLKEWITHTAIDIKADKTSVVKSAADGIVKSIVNDPRYGLTVVVEHQDGYQTVYSNLLTAEFVVEGEEITQGQTIGTVGNTAVFESNMECHLHFELLKDSEYLDPSIYLK